MWTRNFIPKAETTLQGRRQHGQPKSDRRGCSTSAGLKRWHGDKDKLAYTLMINLRRLPLKNTELAKACTATIRVKLLKIGAAVLRNTRRVRLLRASSHPLQHVFMTAARALASP